jgi:PAS domain S-box-containing protein
MPQSGSSFRPGIDAATEAAPQHPEGGMGPGACIPADRACGWLRSLLSGLADAVWIKDVTGAYRCCNPAAIRLLGIDPTTRPGVRDADCFAADQAESLGALERTVLTTGQVSVAEAWLPIACQAGRLGLFALRYLPLRESDGAVTGVLGLARDITGHKLTVDALRQSEARIRALFDATSDSVILADPQGTILAINEHGARRRGLSPGAMIGKSLYEHLPPEAAAARRRAIEEVLATGLDRAYEEERDNARYTISIYPVLDEAGRTGQVASFSRDITARRQAEDALRQLNETLEGRVRRRTAQLEQANQELTRALNQLTSAQKQLVESEKMAALGGLVAGIAHEINTPVGIGVTAASHLEARTQALRDAYQDGRLGRSDLESYLSVCAESTRMILSNLERAAALIRSFKQVAVDQSSEQRRVFRLRAYLDEVLLSLRPRLKNTGHVVTVACDPELTMDSYPGAVSQIVANLVLNSLLHAFAPGQAGRIDIAATLEADTVRLVYADNGQGMAPGLVEKIFEPFFTTRRGRGGTGLGLHILYNLVTQRLHGTVACHSAQGQGATFTMLLPREERRDEPSRPD